MRAERLDATSTVASAAALVLFLAWSRSLNSGPWTAKAAATLVLGGLALPYLLARPAADARGATWAARAFVVSAGVSTVFAARPPLAVTGLYGVGTGLMLLVAAASAWALGLRVSARGRSILGAAVLGGALVNAVLAVAEMAFDLTPFGFGRVLGRAPALFGNPVFASSAIVVAVPFLVEQARRPGRGRAGLLGIVALVVGAATRITGGRLAAILLVVALAASYRAGRRALAVVGVALVLGVLIAPALDRPPAPSPAASSPRAVAGPTQSTVAPAEADGAVAEWLRPSDRPLAPRLATWWAARRAVLRDPVVGSGPGQFRAATVRDRPRVVAVDTPEAYFTDAHNLLVESAVTTGIVGVAALTAWIALALRHVAGPLAVAAALLLVTHLVQPLHVGITPLMFLLLGAARVPRSEAEPSRATPRRLVVVVGGVAGALAAGTLLAGDAALRTAELDFRSADATLADRLLPPWPQPALTRAKLEVFRARSSRDRHGDAAERWAREAVARDENSPTLWSLLGEVQLWRDDAAAAETSFRRALALDRYSVRAMTGLGRVALRRGALEDARRWWRAALEIDPDGPALLLLPALDKVERP